MTALSKLINAFVIALEVEENEVDENLKYSDDKRWDSTAHMILIAQLENDFDVMFDIDDIIDMSSLTKAKEILIKYNESLSF